MTPAFPLQGFVIRSMSLPGRDDRTGFSLAVIGEAMPASRVEQPDRDGSLVCEVSE
jgi:hypothetical protein